MILRMNNYVLIPAAGAGSRMGRALPKQYLPLLDKPLVYHTLSACCAHPAVSGVIVVISRDDMHWDTYDWREFGSCLTVLRCGGETRAATVLNGLRAMDWAAEDWVLVHDAARPCINAELLDRLFHELRDDEVGGLLAVPVADTLKRATSAQRVASTESRENLWQAQTPQMFRYGLLKQALEAFGSNTPTDEAQAVERMGFSPRLVLGERNNLKVTFPEDMDMASMLLQARRQA